MLFLTALVGVLTVFTWVSITQLRKSRAAVMQYECATYLMNHPWLGRFGKFHQLEEALVDEGEVTRGSLVLFFPHFTPEGYTMNGVACVVDHPNVGKYSKRRAGRVWPCEFCRIRLFEYHIGKTHGYKLATNLEPSYWTPSFA